MVSTVLAYDAIGASYSHLPPGQHAGYTTGSGGIAWSASQWASSPGAVRIDQDWQASDYTADILDVENGAATPAQCPGWARAALANYQSGARPGQRSPAIYVNGSQLPSVCNSLIAGGVTSGVGIWLANWSLNASAAADKVVNASGPFPIIGVQFNDFGLYDASVFSCDWLNTVSGGLHPVIGAGAAGAAVLLAQQRLNVWGAALTADGSFGPATSSAVAVFQAAHGLAADGVIGSLTWLALDKDPAPLPVAFQAQPPPGVWAAGTVTTLTGTGSSGTGQWKTATGDGLRWSPPVAAGVALPAVTLAPSAYSCTVTAPGWWKEGTPLEVSGTGTDGRIWRATTTDGKTWSPLVIWVPPVPPPGYTVTVPPPGQWKTGTALTLSGAGPEGAPWTATFDGKNWTGPFRDDGAPV